MSCAWGTFNRFVPRWKQAISGLRRRPDAVRVETWPTEWRHPQAGMLDRAIRQAETEWVWIVDIDDTAFPDGLDGIDDVDADVWQMGYADDHGVTQHLPPVLSNAEYLALRGNPYAGGSALRKAAYFDVGGFPDIAFQDWALWRRMAAAGHTFRASDRAHYIYHRHEDTRSATELTPGRRDDNVREMFQWTA